MDSPKPHRHWWQTLSGHAVRFILIGAVVLLAANLARSVQRNYAISRELRRLNESIQQEQSASQRLTFEITYYQSATYKELEARKRLGYARPGETLVLAPENRDTAQSSDDQAVATGANEARRQWDDRAPYEQWWLLFFGPQTLLEEVFRS